MDEDFEVEVWVGREDTYRRHLSWALMRQLGHESNLLWIVVGNFNELLSPDKKRDRLPYSLYLCNKFKDTRLQDFGFVGHRFTWEKWRDLHNWVEERLDRAVASESWLERFNQSRMVHIPISSSGHLPIFLELKHFVKVYRRRRFK
uniref:Endonuclease/exonuclease/phosphatase domain-containing protein n=1 Tax=Manihot esculenta TaxID=3983 RepID=A0A2C9WJ26_MANES